MKYFALALLFLPFLTACDGAKGGGQGNPKDTVPTVSEPRPKEVALFCTDIGEEQGIPRYEISLMYDGMPSILDTINACKVIPAEDWTSMDIPAKALAAAGGWYAGGGDYFYVVPEGAGIRVYKGWQDESQEDKGFHWQPAGW
jgi:hypothetical protein